MSAGVTFLLTEVVDSIRQWELDEPAMTRATERLDATVRATVAAHNGVQVKPRGEGDSHFLTFDDPLDAVRCAAELQRAVADEPLLALRSSCHVGPAEFRNGDWYGTTVNRCARLRAAAHARQALVSADIATLITPQLPADTTLRSLGFHRLKDLDTPTEIFQVCAPGLVVDHPPLATLLQSHGLPLPSSSFIGRAEELAQVAALLADGAVVTVTGPPGVGTSRFALEAAAAWWHEHGQPVRVEPDPSPRDADAPGPMIRVARHARAPVVRLTPLSSLDAQVLLRDRVPDDVSLPDDAVLACDGLPLAIELLARRAAALAPDELLARLTTDPFAVLGGHRRAQPPRHASVRATFRDAFDALDLADQRALLADARHSERLVAAGWEEPDGTRLPLLARFLDEIRAAA